ncbi:protein-disulfide reductase DsbD domain-containing protein [Pseudooctadecabacter sp.]|uniref:protein-disulfide reductase DsbD domain-containing protein n=1 Tax=Pseudooctadecabacter sp. TaxID=1966338 RepID=UPI0035C7FB80
MTHRILNLALAALTALPFANALAANPADGVVELEVLPGWRTQAGTHMAGLEITLAPGWKTYWRVPGDGGIPPRFAWDGSENLQGVALHWPVPEVSRINNMRSIGYEGIVVIPVELALDDAGAPARMAGRVQIGVCEEICVPVMLSFDAALPVDGRRDAAIVASLVDRPRTVAEAGVGDVSCAIAPIDGGLRVIAEIPMPPMGTDEEVVIESGDQQVWVSEPHTWREGRSLFASSDMIHVDRDGFTVNRSDMRITVIAGGQSVDIRGCAAG